MTQEAGRIAGVDVREIDSLRFFTYENRRFAATRGKKMNGEWWLDIAYRGGSVSIFPTTLGNDLFLVSGQGLGSCFEGPIQHAVDIACCMLIDGCPDEERNQSGQTINDWFEALPNSEDEA